MNLELPVFHAGYFRAILSILQAICKDCSRSLLPIEERALQLRRLRSTKLDGLQRKVLVKNIMDRCKKSSSCPYCSAPNGTSSKLMSQCNDLLSGVTKKVGPLRIRHEKFKLKGGKLADSDDLDDHLRSVRFPVIMHTLTDLFVSCCSSMRQ